MFDYGPKLHLQLHNIVACQKCLFTQIYSFIITQVQIMLSKPLHEFLPLEYKILNSLKMYDVFINCVLGQIPIQSCSLQAHVILSAMCTHTILFMA